MDRVAPGYPSGGPMTEKSNVYDVYIHHWQL